MALDDQLSVSLFSLNLAPLLFTHTHIFSTGVEVGLAWLKQLCNTDATTQKSKDGKQQYVSGAGVSAISKFFFYKFFFFFFY